MFLDRVFSTSTKRGMLKGIILLTFDIIFLKCYLHLLTIITPQNSLNIWGAHDMNISWPECLNLIKELISLGVISSQPSWGSSKLKFEYWGLGVPLKTLKWNLMVRIILGSFGCRSKYVFLNPWVNMWKCNCSLHISSPPSQKIATRPYSRCSESPSFKYILKRWNVKQNQWVWLNIRFLN